jgi:hypothetical protein
MRISIYIEHDDLNKFYKWVNRLLQGHIESSPVHFSHRITDKFKDPLVLSLDANEYAIILDATEEAKQIADIAGPVDIEFSPVDIDWQMSTIRGVVKNAERHNLLTEVIYIALRTLSALPTISPAEAMIIAEGECVK